MFGAVNALGEALICQSLHKGDKMSVCGVQCFELGTVCVSTHRKSHWLYIGLILINYLKVKKNHFIIMRCREEFQSIYFQFQLFQI